MIGRPRSSPLFPSTPLFGSGDMEEILADPTMDAVIVAGDSGQRPLQLRRALQSERHVLCVFPPDQSPDITYEAAMIQADTRRVDRKSTRLNSSHSQISYAVF